MNNIEIDKILRACKYTKKYFLGVFSSDTLPKKINKSKMLVVNFDESALPGRHWCSILVTPKCLEFFDSAGVSLEINPYFKNFIKRNRRSVMIYNTKQLQSNQSSLCGEYCCLYLIYRAKGGKFKDFLNLFSGNYTRNDQKVKRIFRRIRC